MMTTGWFLPEIMHSCVSVRTGFVNIGVFLHKAKKKSCLVSLTRPTLKNWADPKLKFWAVFPDFYKDFKNWAQKIKIPNEKKKEEESRPTYPIFFGHFRLTRQLFFWPNNDWSHEVLMFDGKTDSSMVCHKIKCCLVRIHFNFCT